MQSRVNFIRSGYIDDLERAGSIVRCLHLGIDTAQHRVRGYGDEKSSVCQRLSRESWNSRTVEQWALGVAANVSVAVDVFGSMTRTLLLPPTTVPTSTLGGRHDTQQLISIIIPR